MNKVVILPDGTGEAVGALRQGNYLQAVRMLSDLVDETDFGSCIYYSYALQALGQFAEAQSTLKQQVALFPLQALQICAMPQQPLGQKVSLADAPLILKDAVKKHRIVILGEEHHNSEHRAFGLQVLPMLMDAGITHLAMETGFQSPLDKAVQTKQVTCATDEFSYEPQRASLLRTSIALHLPIVAFDMDEVDRSLLSDHEGMWGEYRERRMAEHIIERILEKDTNTRVLVWVGYNHPRKHTYP